VEEGVPFFQVSEIILQLSTTAHAGSVASIQHSLAQLDARVSKAMEVLSAFTMHADA
jgi:hypothetical protein